MVSCNVAIWTLLASLLLCPVTYSGFVHLQSGCEDGGVSHAANDVWYRDQECARYGCFNPDSPGTYKMTCPSYPIPDCLYKLVSSPDAPFPGCCVRSVCL